MARVAVFDSGLGSLSLVGPLMRATRGEVIYLADRRSYPYGAMSAARLGEAVRRSIVALRARFSPDAVVVGAFERRSIDAATLSSTHLSLLLPLLRRTMPHVTFVDPAASVAARVARIVGVARGPATLSVYTTAAPARLAADLARLGMPHAVSAL